MKNATVLGKYRSKDDATFEKELNVMGDGNFDQNASCNALRLIGGCMTASLGILMDSMRLLLGLALTTVVFFHFLIGLLYHY